MAGSMTQSIRKTPTDDLDFYPTQPWATRALVEMVRPQGLIWEPACGGGHMAEVLSETNPVVATDVHDYGYRPMLRTMDFLTESLFSPDWMTSNPSFIDWIITNPPFARGKVEAFATRAVETGKNVALLCRLSWLEGSLRYNKIFGPKPPSRVIVLPERLGFHKGTCEVGRSGMLPYAWYVWEQERWGDTTILEWAPASSKARLTRPEDADKYNRPVAKTEPLTKFDGDPEDWGRIHPKLMEWAKETARKQIDGMVRDLNAVQPRGETK